MSSTLIRNESNPSKLLRNAKSDQGLLYSFSLGHFPRLQT